MSNWGNKAILMHKKVHHNVENSRNIQEILVIHIAPVGSNKENNTLALYTENHSLGHFVLLYKPGQHILLLKGLALAKTNNTKS